MSSQLVPSFWLQKKAFTPTKVSLGTRILESRLDFVWRTKSRILDEIHFGMTKITQNSGRKDTKVLEIG